MSFLAVIQAVRTYLGAEGRVSLAALRREFELDEGALRDLVQELTEVRGLAHLEGEILVARQPDGSDDAAEVSDGAARGESGERRYLTILFCDLAGSTDLSTRLDPEELSETMREYHASVTSIVERYGGHVAQHLGDGQLVYFGYPHAQEDSAPQAVRAALDIPPAVTALGRDLEVRIGLHTGPCVVRDIGTGGRAETLALGETPNVAARVQGVCERGDVMISDATRRQVEGWFVLEDAGRHSLKGLSEPMALHRVEGRSDARSRLDARGGRADFSLVDRVNESRALREAWRHVCDVGGRAILLSGEAGIGKSSVTRAFKVGLRGEPHRWLETGCSLYARNTAFDPIVGLLEQAFAATADGSPDGGGAAAGTDRIVELIALLPGGGRGEPLEELSPEARRRRIIESVVEWLRRVSGEAPVVLAIEDLHWCDPSTLELVDVLVQELADMPVMLLLTCRPEFRSPWEPSDVGVVSLDRMDDADSAELVRCVLAELALPDAVQARIVERADGVPLFAEELTQMALELSRATRDEATLLAEVPATLESSLMARLDRLGPGKQLAQIASVIGREFSLEMMRHVSDRAEEVVVSDFDDALRRLLASGIVQDAGDHLTFRHALLHDAAYRSLLKRSRRALHSCVVDVIETRFPSRMASTPETVAWHAENAGRTAEAIDLYERAGLWAAERSAHEEALAHLRTALSLISDLDPGSARDRREADLQRTLAVELITARGYAHPDTAAAWERMREITSSIEDEAIRVPPSLGLCVFEYASGRIVEADRLVDGVLALPATRADPVYQLTALSQKTQVSYFLGRFADSLAHAERGMELYDPQAHHRRVVQLIGDDAGLSLRGTSAWVLWHLGRPDSALRRMEEAWEIASALGHPFSMAQVMVWRTALHMLRRDDATADCAQETVRFSEKQGFALWAGGGRTILGHATGDIDLVMRGLAEAAESGVQAAVPTMLWLVADTNRRLGQFDEALMVLDGVEPIMETQPFYNSRLHCLRAQIRAAMAGGGDSGAEVEESFRRALTVADEQGALGQRLAAAIPFGRWLRDDGRRDTAEQILRTSLEPFQEGFGTKDHTEATTLLRELTGN